MQYVVKNTSGYYKFFRKIPNTNQQFIFSLNTKNYKIASKIVTSFLLKSNQYFLYLKNLTKEEVMDKIEEIKEVLEAYKLEALKEYSELEKSRHKHFVHNGSDGSSPEAIEHWVEELQEHIIGVKTERQSHELVRQILKRSTLPLKHYYQQLDNQYKEAFMQLLIKYEASILKEDYKRAKEYFDLDYHLEKDKEQHLTKTIISQINTQFSSLNPQEFANELSYAEKEKYRSKTKFELYEKFLQENQHRKNEKDKIQSSLLTLLQSSEEKYMIDYEKEDYDIFFKALLFTPLGIALKKKIFLEYEGNFVAIAEDFQNNEIDSKGYVLEMQSITTLDQKLRFANDFLKFCTKNGYLDHNILDNNVSYSIKQYKNIAKRAKEREQFNAEELIKMFDMMIDNGFFKEKIEQFYIPMISLFSGMRVEEIAQLEKRDIGFEDKIYYFNINHNVKTTSSIRKVPIHNFLIQELKFLEFIATKKENEKLFNLDPLPMNGKNKYSHYYIMDFSKLRKQFVSERRISEDLVSFHSFRHTFASRLADGEVEETMISRLLGHKLTKNETPRYTKSKLQRLNTEVQKLDIKDIRKQLTQLALQFNRVVKF
ncbi:site-specific integrase [Sulfurospirillum sp. MES]|uniref:site-specific integrase n=1 Tax=Sulfurospirillum sp. MES TaxID=1565314 RepID=UPI000541FEAE|nr:site-specific integrase [Sulfurospirillum sp. MES]KHG33011.1 MAG: hypothetical protein OA34_12110 [Sulfurospirillum sp. MES]